MKCSHQFNLPVLSSTKAVQLVPAVHNGKDLWERYSLSLEWRTDRWWVVIIYDVQKHVNQGDYLALAWQNESESWFQSWGDVYQL